MRTVRTSYEKRGLTLEEFMAAYGIRRTKTYEEINSGRLRARRAGGRTIIASEDAEAWLAALPDLRQAHAA